MRGGGDVKGECRGEEDGKINTGHKPSHVPDMCSREDRERQRLWCGSAMPLLQRWVGGGIVDERGGGSRRARACSEMWSATAIVVAQLLLQG